VIRSLLDAQPGHKPYQKRLEGPGRDVRWATLPAAWSSLNMLGAAPTTDVDVVVTDFGHVNSVGEQLTRRLRLHEQASALPVLGVAMDDTDEAFVSAVDAGVSDWLALPFTNDDAVARIERLLSSGTARMHELYGVEDAAELRLLSSPEAVAAGAEGAPMQERIQTAREANRRREDERLQGMLNLLPDDVAAEFADRQLDDAGRTDLEEAFKTAQATRRLKPIVCGYDFKHPARVNKDQLRSLENVHDEVARCLSYALSATQRSVVDVDVAFVDQTSYAEFIASLSNPAVSYQFLVDTMGPTEVVMDVAMPVVWSLVDRAHGGRGSGAGVEPRQITPLEMGIANRFAKRAIEELEGVWSNVLGPTTIHDIELETNPEYIGAVANPEIVILIAFEVNSAHVSGLISLCYPFFTLEPILPALGSQTVKRVRQLEDPRPDNRLRLGGMRMPAVVELGRTKIKVGEAAALTEGDVIRLDARSSDPAQLYIGGKPKFLGWPQTEQGRVQLQVAGRIPPSLQVKLGTVDSRHDPAR
jgi:flagellar motor switch protein FliM